jgi:hypothetical protein
LETVFWSILLDIIVECCAFYRDVFEPGSLSSQARLKPLLKQVVEDIVDPNRPELVDISHKSSGLGDLLKSGFGYLVSIDTVLKV